MRTARRLALTILTRVERDQAYASLLLESHLRRTSLPARDRALVTELTNGVLRWRGRLDHTIAAVSERPLSACDLPALLLLRLGVYQLLFLDRIPPHAAVHETVALAPPRTRSFVNALLRRVAREGEAPLPPRSPDLVRHLAVKTAHPPWVVARWLTRFGEEETEAMLAANNAIPPVSLAVNTLRVSPEAMEGVLERRAEKVEGGQWVPGFFRVWGGRSLWEAPAFRRGFYFPMDEAAALPVLLLDPQPGETVMDACAGGGGKAAFAALRMGGRGTVLAVDVSPRALRRLREACRRLGLTSCVIPQAGDARRAATVISGVTDRVLVDVPCTGFGTLRRHPEIRWRRLPEDSARLALLQQEILAGAAAVLRDGGVMVYSTCTVEPEENEEVVEAFLAAHPEFHRDDPRPYIPAALVTPRGDVQTWPHRHGVDGFYAVRLRRGRSG